MSQAKIFDSLRFTIPDAWEDRSIYTFVGPEETLASAAHLPTFVKTKGIRPNVVVTRERVRSDLATYASEQLTASRKQLPGVTILEEHATEVPLGKMILRTFTFSADGATTVRQLQAYVLQGDFAYTFTFSTLPGLYEQHRAWFMDILQSAEFE
jgi:hypothetical protein